MEGLEGYGRFRSAIDTQRSQDAERRLREIFEAALPQLDRLISQMREPLLEGRWSSILGDDVSGRFPALILGGIMRRIAESRGEKPPAQFFFAGGAGSGDRQEQLQEYIRTIAPKLGDRALIVTEYIYRGETLRHIAEALERANVPFDIASLASFHEIRREDLGLRSDGELYVGRERTFVTPFFDETRLAERASGITKEGMGMSAITKRREGLLEEGLVRQARALADSYSAKLYERYFPQRARQ